VLAINHALKVLSRTPSNSPNFKTGCSAKFLRITDNYGIKLYSTKEKRKITHKEQQKAHQLGLAPAVGRKFRLTLPENNETVYGYITECVVETYGDRYARKRGFASMIEADDEYDIACEIAIDNDEEYNQLIQNLRENGFCVYDMHFENVGYMKDGRLVAIDFDNV
jgi:hypothetical protein